MNFRRIYFYDYIRIIKPSAIRYVKNISLLIAFSCVVTTIVVLASPATKSINIAPSNSGGGCYDKKIEKEQVKKNYILRRFISYNTPANTF